MADPRIKRPVWQPTRFEELVDGPFATSMGTAKVNTDAGPGFLKALGNPEGPHALACEFVGSSLAAWFGLSVPDFAILTLEEVDCYPLPRGGRTQPGPGFISRHVPGRTWGGSEPELNALENSAHITRLVVFDNWVRNCDRHPSDLKVRKPNYANVYLAETESADRYRLYAIDHTHCFDRRPELTKKLADIGTVKDDGEYGLFPAFRSRIDAGELWFCKGELAGLKRETVEEIVAAVPDKWEVLSEARTALVKFIVDRAAYLVDKMEDGWGSRWSHPPAP